MFSANSQKDKLEMLSEIGVKDIEELFKDIPSSIKQADFNLPKALDEQALTKHIKALAAKFKSGLFFEASSLICFVKDCSSSAFGKLNFAVFKEDGISLKSSSTLVMPISPSIWP